MIFVSNTLAKCSLVICKANQRKVWASGSVLLHRVFGWCVKMIPDVSHLYSQWQQQETQQDVPGCPGYSSRESLKWELKWVGARLRPETVFQSHHLWCLTN